MKRVKFIGWEPGVRKIKFIKLLYEEGGLSLRLSKEIKDRVIGGGETIELDFQDQKIAEVIYDKAKKLGVKCELD